MSTGRELKDVCRPAGSSWARRAVHCTAHVLQKNWAKARVVAGLPEGFTFHDLRHTAHTLAAQNGATTKELMYRMGQSSTGAALRYQHATRDREHAPDRRSSWRHHCSATTAHSAHRIAAIAEQRRTRTIRGDCGMRAVQELLHQSSVSRLRWEKCCTTGTFVESGRRESNPRSQLGKLMFCR